MQDLNDKVTGNSLLATEWNQIPQELQNVILSAGITLSSGDLTQLRKAIAHYAHTGTFYIDSGIADAYVLSPIGSNRADSFYHAGREVEFIVGNTNTGSSTVNVAGQGVKNIIGSEAPGALTQGFYVRLRFDSIQDAFIIASTSNLVGGLFSDDLLATMNNGEQLASRGFVVSGITSINNYQVGSSKAGFLVVPFFEGAGVAAHGLYGVAVDQSTGAIWVVDEVTDTVYKRIPDTVTWIAAPTVPGGGNLRAVDIDPITGDVYVLDTTNTQLYVSRAGIGDWVQLGDLTSGTTGPYDMKGVAFEPVTGDCYVVSNPSGNGRVFRYNSGAGTWSDFTFPGSSPSMIASNKRTGDLWIIDAFTDAVYVREAGAGSFSNSSTGNYPGNLGEALAVNSETGEVYIIDGLDGELYYSPDGEEDFVSVGDPNLSANYLAIYDKTGNLYVTTESTSSEDVLFGAYDTTATWYTKT